MVKFLNILIVGISLTLGACDAPSGIKEVAYPWAPKVEKTTHFGEIRVHPVPYNKKNTEMRLLKKLLGYTRSNQPIYARLIASEPQTLETKANLTLRLTQLKNDLKKLGIADSNIQMMLLDPTDLPISESAVITVAIDQYTVSPPLCPGWGAMPESAAGGDRNFGCASAANLANMIANPKDLLEAQSLGTGSGERNSLFVSKYKEDKIKELKVEKVDIDE
ncbi:MAG: hypothetical protein IBJ00_05075 [Alphaproteobacteria bacterium]|nr:hypothetical protein [Alphaproteobacteria bacterium]